MAHVTLMALAFVVASFGAGQGAAQERPRAAPDPLLAAREIMRDARYCTLVTFADDGYPHARTMDAFAPEADLTVWLGTNPRSRKVAEIRKNPRVTLHYFDPSRTGTVTLFGVASLVDDPAEKQQRWKDEWKAFYPDRGAYLLIRVTPERLEVSSQAHGIANDPVTWRPVTIDLAKRKD